MAVPKKESVRQWLISQFGEDEALMGEIFGEYLRTTGETIAKAVSAMAGEDYRELDRIAHTLKGNALMVGDQDAADAAYEMRNASKASDRAGCEAALAKVRRIFDEVNG